VEGKSFTWFAGIGLHEVALGASLGELRSQPSKLGQHLVNEAYLGCKLVLVNVLGEEAADVAQASNNEDGRLLFSHYEASVEAVEEARVWVVSRKVVRGQQL
jgi:hypothetical protein